MKRKEFINFALLFAVARQLPFTATEEELFRFDFSSVKRLLEKAPPAERETASLMIKNLLYDMEYLFKRATEKTDLAGLKKLAVEADQQFYTENKLKAGSFSYHPLTTAQLEAAKRNTSLKPGEYDTMVKTLKYYTNKINTSNEKFEKLIPQLLEEADQAAQIQKEAEAKVGCAKVVSIVAAVIIVVVAIVVAAFTFGAAGALVALSVIAAAAIIGGSISNAKDGAPMGAVIGSASSVLIVSGSKTILDKKVKLPWVDFDKMIKCAFLSEVTAITSSVFSVGTYPTQAMMGSVAVNILGITKKMPGIQTDC